MSLVGPRPALAAEVAEFPEELQARHQVRPGITGLWQVEARDNPSFEAYRRLDLFYVENWSLALDLLILLGTVEQVLLRPLLSRRGAAGTAGRGVGRRSPPDAGTAGCGGSHAAGSLWHTRWRCVVAAWYSSCSTPARPAACALDLPAGRSFAFRRQPTIPGAPMQLTGAQALIKSLERSRWRSSSACPAAASCRRTTRCSSRRSATSSCATSRAPATWPRATPT